MSKNAPGPQGAHAVAWAALALLVLAPAAAALPQPAFYFLRDTPLPQTPAGTPHLPVQGIPVGNGELVMLVPPGLPPVPANATDPQQLMLTYQKLNATQQRLIFPAQENVLPTQFVSNASANTGRIYGPIVVFLVLPNTPLVRNGNLSVQLVVLPKDASPTDLPPKGKVIASTSFALDFDQDNLPNATSLVPPDPTNPTAALGYIQAQLTAYGFSQVAGSYKVAFLHNSTNSLVLNEVVDKDSSVALRLVLEPGSSPLSMLPMAAGQPLVYNNALTPSWVYVPWYAPDPVRAPSTFTKSPTSSHPANGGAAGGAGGATTVTPTKKKSPGLEVPLVIVGLAAMVLVARRRLR